MHWAGFPGKLEVSLGLTLVLGKLGKTCWQLLVPSAKGLAQQHCRGKS